MGIRGISYEGAAREGCFCAGLLRFRVSRGVSQAPRFDQDHFRRKSWYWPNFNRMVASMAQCRAAAVLQNKCRVVGPSSMKRAVWVACMSTLCVTN